jgi:hypothetical protein
MGRSTLGELEYIWDGCGMQTRSDCQLRELSAAECDERLASVDRGQLATSWHALPAIVPVWIRRDGDAMTIASMLGREIPLLSGMIVALEAGPLGEDDAQSWAVEVCGTLETRRDSAQVLPRSASLAQWILFQLTPDRLRGWTLNM